MRSQTFHTLNVDCLLKIFECLGNRNLSSWFSAASTDKLFLHVAYSIVAIEFKKKYYVHRQVEYACDNVMRQADNMRDAKTQTSTAKYFLHLGLDKCDIMYRAARYGHVSTLSMLHQWRVNFWKPHCEVAFLAARSNQGNVIEFMQEHNLLLKKSDTDDKVVNIAIEKLSSSVIRAMGQAGFNFGQINPKLSISYMQQAMKFELGESKLKLNKRYDVLLAMLESGSFPKMSVTRFMSWMDEHFESKKPRFSGGMFAYAGTMLDDDFQKCFQYIHDQIDAKKTLQIAYDEVRPKIRAALIKFECEYHRLSNSVNKTRDAKAGRQVCEEKGMELASAPMKR